MNPKKKSTDLSVYDLEGEMIDVIRRLQLTQRTLMNEGYNKNTIEYVPEKRWENEKYIIVSEKI